MNGEVLLNERLFRHWEQSEAAAKLKVSQPYLSLLETGKRPITKIYLDRVGIATLPKNYEDRTSEIFIGCFQNLNLFALDPPDIALVKIERNIDRDRENVKFLAESIPFDLKLLEQIYQRTASRSRQSRKRRFNFETLDGN